MNYTKPDVAKWLEENRGLIEKVVKVFYRPGVAYRFDRDDLVQECIATATHAINMFDESKNTKLSTYVWSAIWNTARNFVGSNKHDLHVPNSVLAKEWKKTQELKANGVENPPDNLSYAQAISMDADTYFTSDNEACSLRDVIPSGEACVMDTMIKHEQIQILLEEVDALPDREKSVIQACYLNGQKISDVARDEGVSRQCMHQISKRALKRLKSKMQQRLSHDVLI